MPISGRQVSHLLLFKKTDIEISGRIEKENEGATHAHTLALSLSHTHTHAQARTSIDTSAA